MKWLFIPAAALSLAVAMPALAAPDSAVAWQGTQGAYIQLAQNNDQLTPAQKKRAQQRAKQQRTKQPAAKKPAAKKPAVRTQRTQQQRTQQQQRNKQQQLNQQRRTQQQRTQQQRNKQQQLNQQRRTQQQRTQQQRNKQQQLNQQRRTQQQRNIQANRRRIQRQRYNWGTYRPGQRPPLWARNRNFNRQLWERNFRAQQRYRWTTYNRPRGWYAQNWTFGMVLPRLFWSQNYWINGYDAYGLDDPPYGYVWVRNGSDAMLVNVETGYILQVVYGLFY